jgi:polyisoprenoid-binding protein YceI
MKMFVRLSQLLVALVAISSSAVAGEIYKFDQSASTIGFTVHQYLGTTRGKFAKFSGKIDIDRERAENSSVVAKIDAASIDTRIQKRDNHLRSAEFFDVAKYPEITFKSRSATRTGPQSGDIAGELTMHGVTKPIVLHVKLLTSPDDTHKTRWAVTTEPLNRREFNLMFSQGAEAISGISQSVAINIEIEATRTD